MLNMPIEMTTDGPVPPNVRYPALYAAGAMLRRYAGILYGLAILGAVAAAVLFILGASADNSAQAGVWYSLAFSALGYAGITLFASILARGVGEAAFALADMATNTERVADALAKLKE